MAMTESIEDMLVRQEGEVLHAYQDSKDLWSIGVGQLIDQRAGGKISQAASRFMLQEAIQESVHFLKSYPWYEELNNPRKTAMISMMYNLGPSRFAGFQNMIQAFKDGDYERASKEMLDSKAAREDAPNRYRELAKIIRDGQ